MNDLYVRRLARITHVITSSTFIPQKALNSSMKKQQQQWKQLKPLTVDSSNSLGLYLRLDIFFFSKVLETPGL